MTHSTFSGIISIIFILMNVLPALASGLPLDPSAMEQGKMAGNATSSGEQFSNGTEFDGRFQKYHTYESMVEDITMVQGLYPDIVRLYDLSKKSDLGKTYGGRSVWAAKVGKGVGTETEYYDDPDRPNVLFIGAHHAREWMSYEVCLYTLFYLAYNYGRENIDNDGDGLINEDILDGEDNDNDGLIDEDPSEGRVNFLVDNREIWIVPMLNPDGVVYDHTISRSGENGGWRKNMRDNNRNGNFDRNYDGVDLNRNYPFMWWANRKLDGEGRTSDSSIPSSDMYRGPPDLTNQDGDSFAGGILPKIDEDPVDGRDNDGDGRFDEDRDGGFSEPETQAIRSLVKTYDDQPDTGNMPFSASLSYHSYGNMVLWPWGYTQSSPPHSTLFEEVGGRMAEMTGYEGKQAIDLYPTAGDSEDWLYGTGNVLAFTIELEGPDGGFHPSKEHILPICRKVLGPNLYLAGEADRIDVAKQYYLRIDESILDLEIVNPVKIIRADENLTVEVDVKHPDKLVPETLRLYYSYDGQTYCEKPLEVDRSSGYYSATLVRIPPNTLLRYYVSGRDVSGISVRAPEYGRYDPQTLRVVEEKGLSSLENVIMVMMMVIILSIVWGGFAGLLIKAYRIEKVKTAYPA